jgi:D-alanyl-D-alanine-carboxypeptidase/D-alanyl-D-alanine-endopeptidase
VQCRRPAGCLRWRTAFLFAAAFALLPPRTGSAAGLSTVLANRIDRLVQNPVIQGRTVGIIAGVRVGNQEMVFSHGAVVRGGGRPTPATVFQIGSITMAFTATLLALFARRGLINLDDPLQTYVPGWVIVPSYRGNPITLLDLATHTAALPRNPPIVPGHNFTTDQLYRYLEGLRLRRAPGTRYSYSDFGFALLAHALMAAVGSRYDSMLQRSICMPLNMTDTRIKLTPGERTRIAQGYTSEGRQAADTLPGWPALIGANGLNSTMADMMKFLAFNMGAARTPLNVILPILRKPRLAAGGDGREIALAWEIAPLAPGDTRTVMDSAGATEGFAAFIGYVRETSTGVVILANQRFPVRRLGLRLLRVINSMPNSATSSQVHGTGNGDE